MPKNGLDAREFAERLKAASPDERDELTRRFSAWIREGAKARGPFGAVGILLFVAAAFTAIQLATSGHHSLVLYAACLAGVISGVLIFDLAAKRERAWREANPFDSWQG